MIRPALPADLPHLVAMGGRFIADTEYSQHLRGNPEAMGRSAAWLMEHGVVLVAEHAGTLVGMIGIGLVPDPYSGELMATEMFWWSESPGAGLKLWKAGEAWAKASGAVRMQMVAPNGRVAGLYERRGYGLMERVYTREL